MRSLSWCALVLLLPLFSFAQPMVKVDIFALYDKIPLPPADAREAYSRTQCAQEPNTVTCNADRFYQDMTDQLNTIGKQIETTLKALAQPTADKAKQIDAKAIREKMKSMSNAEKMQYAMEMNKQMGMGPGSIAPEPPAVMAAQQECSKVAGEVGQDVGTTDPAYYKESERLEQERQLKHRQIDTWKEEETKKLPQVSYGEMGGPEPRAFHALMLKVMDKHLAAENDYLKAMKNQWLAERVLVKRRYASLQPKLEAAHYGEDARNAQTKQVLVNAQGMMLAPLARFLGTSKKATEEAAGWMAQKKVIESSQVDDPSKVKKDE